MKTDTIFYTLFQNIPSLLFELLEQPTNLALRYEFTSVEVKELARCMDGLFVPKAKFSDEPIYFVEAQFQKDDDLYWRLITEAFIYLNQYKPAKPWKAVVIWAKRSLDPGVPIAYQTSLAPQQIRIIYLDELAEVASSSIGLGVVKLVVAPKNEAIKEAKSLINQVQQENAAKRRDLLELVGKVLVYKFTNKSRKELEAMFGLTEWRQTRFYQEVKEETKLEAVPKLFKAGLSIEQIAEALELDVEIVRKAVQKQDSEEKGV